MPPQESSSVLLTCSPHMDEKPAVRTSDRCPLTRYGLHDERIISSAVSTALRKHEFAVGDGGSAERFGYGDLQ